MKSLTLKQKIIGIGVIFFFIGVICGLVYYTLNDDDYHVSLKEGNEVLASGDITITKQEYFNTLLESNGANSIMSDTIDYIAKKEVTDTEALKEAVEQETQKYETYAQNGLEAYAKSVNYKDAQDFIENFITPKCRLDLLTKQYVTENYDTFNKSYKVSHLYILEFEKESEALEVIKDVKDLEAFKELGATDMGIVTKNSTTLDSNLVKKLDTFNKLKKDGIYQKVVKLSTDQYAVIYCEDVKGKDKESRISTLIADTDVQTEIETIYLKKYNFTVYSKKLLKEVKEINEDLFK